MSSNNEIILSLNEVYSKLIELTDGEEDTELNNYNEYLLDNIQETIKYIRKLNEKSKHNEELLRHIRAECGTCQNYESDICMDCGLEHVFNEWRVSEELIK